MRFNRSTRLPLAQAALVFCIILTPLSALAETLYVSDTLRVGIRTLPNNNVPSIAVVKSGAAVEVLKRKGSYIKIRATSGVEGWVKGAYFSKRLPTAKKLNKALTKITSLEKEIKTLNKQTKSLSQNKTPDLSDKLKTLETTNLSLKNEIKTLKNNTSTESNVPTLTLSSLGKNTIYSIVGGFVVLLCLGFLFGVSWHKGQVTKRLGGMSI